MGAKDTFLAFVSAKSVLTRPDDFITYQWVQFSDPIDLV